MHPMSLHAWPCSPSTQAVACQAAPATLKAALLDPVREELATEVAVELFGRSDQDYMSLFTGARLRFEYFSLWGEGVLGGSVARRLQCGRWVHHGVAGGEDAWPVHKPGIFMPYMANAVERKGLVERPAMVRASRDRECQVGCVPLSYSATNPACACISVVPPYTRLDASHDACSPPPPTRHFPAAGALAALQAKRDALLRRVEGLSKCKMEFQELAKCL